MDDDEERTAAPTGAVPSTDAGPAAQASFLQCVFEVSQHACQLPRVLIAAKWPCWVA